MSFIYKRTSLFFMYEYPMHTLIILTVGSKQQSLYQKIINFFQNVHLRKFESHTLYNTLELKIRRTVVKMQFGNIYR